MLLSVINSVWKTFWMAPNKTLILFIFPICTDSLKTYGAIFRYSDFPGRLTIQGDYYCEFMVS